MRMYLKTILKVSSGSFSSFLSDQVKNKYDPLIHFGVMVDKRITLCNPCIISAKMEDKGIMRCDWPRIIEKYKGHLKQTLLVLNNLLV